ncbi:class V lanthionine synthetase subunit LxmK [Streptomyces sp. NPDC057623]|uniref:class V lanthionine synthetase subunit LxmK n=1 Tax=Streptomyces sp. NPDC057623 TaxID=3346187 RepID=UPI0036999495
MVKSISARERAPGVQPVDLADVPYVDELLIRLGVGRFDPTTVGSVLGRNDNWVGTTAGGTPVFVKRLTEGDRAVRMRRTETICAAARGRLDTPRLIGTDPDHALLVFEYLPSAETGADLAADDSFDETLCDRIGSALAAVHGLDAEGFDTSEHPLPPVANLDALPLRYYTQASAAELAMWRLLHADAPLAQALRELRSSDVERTPSRTPIHGDVRLDQFLLADGTLYVTDFEESRMGDPARDIGAFAGEWLYQAAAAIPLTLADASPLGHTATHEEIIATGVVEIEQRSPNVRHFFRSYLDAAPTPVAEDKELGVRAAAYAGWHMLDRMLATAARSATLSPITKAAAGIGRTVLLSPADFTSSLGLEA